jgi:glycosyltransferase involved in cell wall biosynthesis
VELSTSISVIIPAWNAGKTIGNCIDSITTQTTPPLEIIIVDDGSNDDTPGKAVECGAVLLSTGGRRGPATARNMGANAASGDVILFLDSDVTVDTDLIEKLSVHFEDESVWAVQTLYTPLCPAGNTVSQYQNYYYYYSLNRMPAGSTATFASWCSAVRRNRFMEIGSFNVKIPEPTVEDEELGYTIVDKGGIIILDKTVQVTHLACYDLIQFTRRRLRMAKAQAKSGWRQTKRRLFARYINVHESGTHHSRWVVLSIILVLIAELSIIWSLVTLSPAGFIPSAFLLAAALLCHSGFLTRCSIDLNKKVALTFSLMCLYDMAVLGWGIVYGTIQYAFGKKY